VSVALTLLLGASLVGRGPCAGAEADLRSAAAALDTGRWADAERLSALALAVNPDCPDALVLQGRILSRQGRLREAREALEKAVRLAPASAEARYQLGVWLYRRQLYADAVAQFEKVVALRPADARAHAYLALDLEGLGEPEKADLAYRAALGVNGGPLREPFLDYYYGRFLLKQNRLEESRSHLDRAVVLHPDERATHYERGKLNLARKDYGAARQDAERALGLADPAGLVLDLQVYYLLATVYARLGDTELARKYAELSRTTPIEERSVPERRIP
jgi:tetratricopeptide (TPR) repeat protein